MTCANSAVKNSSPNPVAPAATTYYHQQPAPSPPSWPCATTSSHPSSPASEAPRMGRKPTHWTRIDRDYETLRINMHTLFHDLGITTTGAAAA